MKKLLFVPVALAVPLAICATNLTDRVNAQGTTTVEETLSPAPSLTKDWYRYTAKDGSYSALFPGQPQEKIESDSSVQVVYEDRANDRIYAITQVKLRANLTQNEIEKALGVAVVSLSEDGSTVTDQKNISHQGLPGREVIVRGQTGEKKGIVMKMRMFIEPKESAIYIVAVIGKKGNLDFPEAQVFLDSASIKF